MKTIKVSSLPLKDVIADIASGLNIPYAENCTLYELRLPELIGEGTIKGIDFDDGLGLIEYDCVFYEDTVIEFSFNNVPPLNFLFCLDSTFNHDFENDTDRHTIEQYKNAIVATNGRLGHVLRFTKTRIRCFIAWKFHERNSRKKL